MFSLWLGIWSEPVESLLAKESLKLFFFFRRFRPLRLFSLAAFSLSRL